MGVAAAGNYYLGQQILMAAIAKIPGPLDNQFVEAAESLGVVLGSQWVELRDRCLADRKAAAAGIVAVGSAAETEDFVGIVGSAEIAG